MVLLGDASVGKTCLAKFIVHRRVFADQMQATIGFDHHIKQMIVNGIPIMVGSSVTIIVLVMVILI